MVNKLYKYILIVCITLLGISSLSYAQDFFYDMGDGAYEHEHEQVTDEAKVNLGKIMYDDSIRSINDEEAGALTKIMRIFRLRDSSWWADEPTERKAIAYVKMIMNILLGLVSFISLLLLIYAFYLMFFTEQEEGKAKAKKIFIGIGIALFVMGLSWFIVSFIFNIYMDVAQTGVG